MSQTYPILHEAPIGLASRDSPLAETCQYKCGIHSSVTRPPHNRSMAAPSIAIEPMQGLEDAGSYGVEMDVAHQSKEVLTFFTENRLIAVREQMADSFVATVEVLGVPGKELSHYGAYAFRTTAKQQVNVIVHEDPGIDRGAAFGNLRTQPIEKRPLICIVSEDGSPVYPTNDDMMQGSKGVEACQAGHG
jgi:hypothetical protein